jgi:hypothetical protein
LLLLSPSPFLYYEDTLMCYTDVLDKRSRQPLNSKAT